MSRIPTYIINFENNCNSLQTIWNEFNERPEFDVTIIEPVKHVRPEFGLLTTIQHILNKFANKHSEYILICDNNHSFTDNYKLEVFLSIIENSKQFNADILLGNVNSYEIALELSNHLFWIDGFSEFQFAIIFRKCFDVLRRFITFENISIRSTITNLHLNNLLIYPSISYKKVVEVIESENIGIFNGYIVEANDYIFQDLNILKDMSRFYKKAVKKFELSGNREDLNQISIPTYLINLPERIDRKISLEQEFEGRQEFDITFVEAVKHERGNVSLWLTIRKIIQMAIYNDDDVIIICEDDHIFTKYYSKEAFLKMVIEAHQFGADLLSGGIGAFGIGLPITDTAWWINSFCCTQFIVLYKSIYLSILDVPIHDNMTADGVLANIAIHKITMFPFISVQKNFGYSDISPENFQKLGPTIFLFDSTQKRLENYNKVVKSYNLI